MEITSVLQTGYVWLLVLALLLLKALLIAGMRYLVKWGRKMPKGAYLFLALFPLISIFPIPPPQFKNVEKAKQEQRKRKEDGGEPPEQE
ncbi:hypothetical protein [Planctobacterium marinum]|uniref:hypothetical protein n=1 Tax=Planctobacterium marinum TaxID=1631968 RepID=UPI001E3350C5|nr:hypothetical protein [Planctobacterium marinum]MCC2603936.1 hypothetical protein [Planctobacterium marinum]